MKFNFKNLVRTVFTGALMLFKPEAFFAKPLSTPQTNPTAEENINAFRKQFGMEVKEAASAVTKSLVKQYKVISVNLFKTLPNHFQNNHLPQAQEAIEKIMEGLSEGLKLDSQDLELKQLIINGEKSYEIVGHQYKKTGIDFLNSIKELANKNDPLKAIELSQKALDNLEKASEVFKKLNRKDIELPELLKAIHLNYGKLLADTGIHLTDKIKRNYLEKSIQHLMTIPASLNTQSRTYLLKTIKDRAENFENLGIKHFEKGGKVKSDTKAVKHFAQAIIDLGNAEKDYSEVIKYPSFSSPDLYFKRSQMRYHLALSYWNLAIPQADAIKKNHLMQQANHFFQQCKLDAKEAHKNSDQVQSLVYEGLSDFYLYLGHEFFSSHNPNNSAFHQQLSEKYRKEAITNIETILKDENKNKIIPEISKILNEKLNSLKYSPSRFLLILEHLKRLDLILVLLMVMILSHHVTTKKPVKKLTNQPLSRRRPVNRVHHPRDDPYKPYLPPEQKNQNSIQDSSEEDNTISDIQSITPSKPSNENSISKKKSFSKIKKAQRAAHRTQLSQKTGEENVKPPSIITAPNPIVFKMKMAAVSEEQTVVGFLTQQLREKKEKALKDAEELSAAQKAEMEKIKQTEYETKKKINQAFEDEIARKERGKKTKTAIKAGKKAREQAWAAIKEIKTNPTDLLARQHLIDIRFAASLQNTKRLKAKDEKESVEKQKIALAEKVSRFISSSASIFKAIPNDTKDSKNLPATPKPPLKNGSIIDNLPKEFQAIAEDLCRFSEKTKQKFYLCGSSAEELVKWYHNPKHPIHLKDFDVGTSADLKSLQGMVNSRLHEMVISKPHYENSHYPHKKYSELKKAKRSYITFTQNPNLKKEIKSDANEKDLTKSTLYIEFFKENDQYKARVFEPIEKAIEHSLSKPPVIAYFGDIKQKLLKDPLQIIRALYKAIYYETHLSAIDSEIIKTVIKENPKLFKELDLNLKDNLNLNLNGKLDRWLGHKILTNLKIEQVQFFMAELHRLGIAEVLPEDLIQKYRIESYKPFEEDPKKDYINNRL